MPDEARAPHHITTAVNGGCVDVNKLNLRISLIVEIVSENQTSTGNRIEARLLLSHPVFHRETLV